MHLVEGKTRGLTRPRQTTIQEEEEADEEEEEADEEEEEADEEEE
jgi:hypothetical protein